MKKKKRKHIRLQWCHSGKAVHTADRVSHSACPSLSARYRAQDKLFFTSCVKEFLLCHHTLINIRKADTPWLFCSPVLPPTQARWFFGGQFLAIGSLPFFLVPDSLFVDTGTAVPVVGAQPHVCRQSARSWVLASTKGVRAR